MIEVYDNGGKTADRYTVVIDQDVYLMSEDAHMPNGVKMYAGTVGEWEPQGRKLTGIGSLPTGTLIAIVRLLEGLLIEAKVREEERG